MKSLEKNKGVLAAVVLFVLALSLYNMFKTDILPAAEPMTPVGSDLVELYARLQSVSLTQDIFSSPSYRFLTDYTVELTAQPTGRSNPFGPIGQN